MPTLKRPLLPDAACPDILYRPLGKFLLLLMLQAPIQQQ